MANNDRIFSSTRKKRKLKDKKIQFYVKEEDAEDEYGTPIPGDGYGIVFNNVWAYARQTSAREIAEFKAHAVQVDYEIDMIFTINYRTGITNDMLIRYKEEVYSITRIDYFEGYKEDIVITGTRYENLDFNKNRDLVPFG